MKGLCARLGGNPGALPAAARADTGPGGLLPLGFHLGSDLEQGFLQSSVGRGLELTGILSVLFCSKKDLGTASPWH